MSHEVEIRWTDVDAFGHVHHIALLAIVEHARSKWIDGRLTSGETWDYAVVRLEMNYRGELRFEDRVACCDYAVERTGTKSITLAEKVLAPDGRLVAEGGCVIVPWDRAGGGTRALTDDERRALAD